MLLSIVSIPDLLNRGRVAGSDLHGSLDDCQRFFDSRAEVGVTGTSEVAGVLTMVFASLGCDSLRVLWIWIFEFFLGSLCSLRVLWIWIFEFFSLAASGISMDTEDSLGQPWEFGRLALIFDGGIDHHARLCQLW